MLGGLSRHRQLVTGTAIQAVLATIVAVTWLSPTARFAPPQAE